MTSVTGLSFGEAWAGRLEGDLGEHRVAFLGLAELLTNKRASRRPKDLLDVELLREAGIVVESGE